jgi:hypothetical protein
LPHATFGNSSGTCPRSTSMGTSSIGPLYLCIESTEFFWCMQEAALCVKCLPQQKMALQYKLGSSSPFKWNHRGSFLITKIKYTDSLYQIKINTSSFSFFYVKIWIFFKKDKNK